MIFTERDMRAYLENERVQLHRTLKGSVHDRILEAMFAVPREEFVDPMERLNAYENHAQPVPGHEEEASISQPSTIADMLGFLDPQSSDFVVEVGTATGYQAAIFGRLTRHVVSYEIIPELAEIASRRLQKLGINNVEVRGVDANTDTTLAGHADKLIITASVAPTEHLPLYALVKEGGAIVVPIGGLAGQMHLCDLVRMRKTKDGLILEAKKPGYGFVPLQGGYGWRPYVDFIIDSHHKRFFERLMERTIRHTKTPSVQTRSQ